MSKYNYDTQVHLTCVKFNGMRPDDVYLYTNVYPHDSATTITIMWITISKVGKID